MTTERALRHEIEVVSDTICPWCYIGLSRFRSALARLPRDADSLTVRHLPFQLNPDMPAEGLDRKLYRSRKFGSWERSLALDAQVEEAGKEAGLSIHHELIQRTPNTLASHMLLQLAAEQGVQEGVVEAVFRAYFSEGRDIGSIRTLVDIGVQAGMQDEELASALVDPGLRASVAEFASRVAQRGVTGVPTFYLNGAPLFSGAQPVETIVELLQQGLDRSSSRERGA